MGNCCCGNLKCVAKNKATLDRIRKILDWKDDEYAIAGCRDVSTLGEAYKEGEFWVQDFMVTGNWNCGQFFTHCDEPQTKIVLGYNKDKEGKTNYDDKIYGTAHLTGFGHICKVLDFGCELYSTEPGCCFEEHCTSDHKGYGINESDSYNLDYPTKDNGEVDFDSEPTEVHGMEDFMEWSNANEIYGID